MRKIYLLIIMIFSISVIVSCSGNKVTKTTETSINDEVTDMFSESNDETDTDEPNLPSGNDDEANKNGLLAIDPDDYYNCIVWDLPEGNFRDIAVDYMRKQAEIEWVCEESFSVIDQFDHWSIGLEYKKGVTYHGITYTNMKSGYDEFMMYYKDGKLTMQSGGSNDVIGNGCFSATQNATQQFDPTVAGVTDVIMPSYSKFEAKIVGNYKVPQNVKTTEEIKLANSTEEIYSAYAQLQKGDLIVTKDDTKGMSHVRMVVESPRITETGAGKFNPSKCYVKTIEQTNAFDTTRRDVKTTWYVDHMYTFSDLYNSNYLPITYESYEKDRSEMEKPYLLLDKEITSEILSKRTVLSTVKSNFPIRFVKIDIFDNNNNVIATQTKNNMEDTRSIPLRNYFFGLFNSIPEGEYTLVLTAGISRGSAELARVDFKIG